MKRRTKRKFKKFMQKHSIVLFIVPVIASIFLLGTAYSLSQQNLSINGNARIGSSSMPGSTCNIGLNFEEMSSWSGGLQFKITFTNNSDKDMKSINIRLKKTSAYKYSWGEGMEVTADDDYYYLAMSTWYYEQQLGKEEDGSQRISLHPGESISSQFSFETYETITMDDIIKLGTITNCGQYDDDSYTEIKNGNAVIKLSPAEVQIGTKIELELESADPYTNQVSYKITVTNNQTFDINDWRANIYYGPDYEYFAIWPYFNDIKNNAEEYNINLHASNFLLAASTSTEFHLVLKIKNPVYKDDGNGGKVIVIDENYLPDVIGAGIKSGEAAQK